MRSKVVVQCPTCGEDGWRFAEAAYVRALLEAGDANLTEDEGVVKVPCGNCGYVTLFDAETVEFGACGTKRGTCDIEGNYPLELAG